jgi:hypothetical protein
LVSPNNLVIPGNDEGEGGLDQQGGYDTANKNTFSDLSAKYLDAIGQPKPGNDEGEVGLDQHGGYDTANKKTFSDLSAKYVDAIGQPNHNLVIPGND